MTMQGLVQQIRDEDVCAVRMCPDLPAIDAADHIWEMSKFYREDYVAIKYAIASVLQPKSICEIGVYSGISALCFLLASPDATYLGIDNLSAKRAPEVVPKAKETLDRLGYKNDIIIADSQRMTALPGMFDFIHVDGDHSRSGARHDILLAWNALNHGGYILTDNGHDLNVCTGVFDALRETCDGLLQWAYFEGSVGDILIKKELL